MNKTFLRSLEKRITKLCDEEPIFDGDSLSDFLEEQNRADDLEDFINELMDCIEKEIADHAFQFDGNDLLKRWRNKDSVLNNEDLIVPGRKILPL